MAKELQHCPKSVQGWGGDKEKHLAYEGAIEMGVSRGVDSYPDSEKDTAKSIILWA